jgi:hypothetical protein
MVQSILLLLHFTPQYSGVKLVNREILMKLQINYMNQKTLVIAAVVSAALLAGIFSTTSLAFAEGDESETNTEQAIKQKNVGSGASTNFNCGENNIDTVLPIQACGTVDLGAVATDFGVPASTD